MSTEIKSQASHQLHVPSLWVCRMLNDDFTPMDFVIEILMTLFNKSIEDAITLTHEVHEKGSAVVGLYTKEIALTKANRACQRAETAGHPLRTIAERG